jgi:RimJ/RimL family protein N-acetyltransferase
MEICLREVQDTDLPEFWEQVTDPQGQQMAAVTVATAALAQLIDLEPARPLPADAAADNAGSIRVLEKCGFAVTGRSRSFARARGEEIELVHLTLG